MTTFYFIRHGLTQNNIERRFNGGTVDTPLVAEGIDETKRIATELATTTFDQAYSSPQMRAQTTAQIILSQNHAAPTIQIDERLRELKLGDWDGKVIDEVKNHPEAYNYFHQPDKFNSEKIHAESYEQLINRGKEFISEINQKNQNQQILVVTHGLFLMTVFSNLKQDPLSQLRKSPIVPNSSLTILKTDGEKAEFVTWGKTF
ncbi:histidine phosphatase family protein [Enterococcus sp. AZ103]|uniref:histidine phosphatase family protein n=1 Tax=Enterococcus sp. AZ103 TaxID=2774628 RepID=UPI003F28372C